MATRMEESFIPSSCHWKSYGFPSEPTTRFGIARVHDPRIFSDVLADRLI